MRFYIKNVIVIVALRKLSLDYRYAHILILCSLQVLVLSYNIMTLII